MGFGSFFRKLVNPLTPFQQIRNVNRGIRDTVKQRGIGGLLDPRTGMRAAGGMFMSQPGMPQAEAYNKLPGASRLAGALGAPGAAPNPADVQAKRAALAAQGGGGDEAIMPGSGGGWGGPEAPPPTAPRPAMSMARGGFMPPGGAPMGAPAAAPPPQRPAMSYDQQKEIRQGFRNPDGSVNQRGRKMGFA